GARAVRGVGAHGELTAERALRRAHGAGMALAERTADIAACRTGGPKAVPLVRRRGRTWLDRGECDVVEVVVDLRRRLDEDDAKSFPCRKRRRRAAGQAVDAQRDVDELTRLTRPLGVEERELEAPRVRPEQ